MNYSNATSFPSLESSQLISLCRLLQVWLSRRKAQDNTLEPPSACVWQDSGSEVIVCHAEVSKSRKLIKTAETEVGATITWGGSSEGSVCKAYKNQDGVKSERKDHGDRRPLA